MQITGRLQGRIKLSPALKTQLRFGIQHFWNVRVSRRPDLQEPFVLAPRLLSITLPFVGPREMIMHERVVRVEMKDAFVFGDGLVKPSKFEIGVGETIFKSIYVPDGRSVL